MEQHSKPVRRGTVVGQSKTQPAFLGGAARLVKRRITSGKCERSRLAWKREHDDLPGKESRTGEGTRKTQGFGRDVRASRVQSLWQRYRVSQTG